MIEFIFDILFSVLFEGMLEAITAKKLPLIIRIAAAIFLLAFYLGFCGILLYIGIVHKSGIVSGCAVFLFLVVACVVIKKYKEIKRSRF